jgi:hypothetical protein
MYSAALIQHCAYSLAQRDKKMDTMSEKIVEAHYATYRWYARHERNDCEFITGLMRYKEFTLAQQLKAYINFVHEYGFADSTYSTY